MKGDRLGELANRIRQELKELERVLARITRGLPARPPFRG